MNAKKAKALRRLAADAAAKGLPEKSYLLSRYQKERNVTVMKDGEPVQQSVKITTTNIQLDPQSVRGTYRNLKRLM